MEERRDRGRDRDGEGHLARTGSSNPRDLTNVGGTLFFTADDGTHGHELWRSDGTRRDGAGEGHPSGNGKRSFKRGSPT